MVLDISSYLNLNNFLFLFLSTFILLGVILIPIVNILIYSIFFFILIILFFVGMLFTYSIEFFSLILLIIYIGAIAVLFIFILMLFNIEVKSKIHNNLFKKLIFFFIFSFFIILLIWLVNYFLLDNSQLINLNYFVDYYTYFALDISNIIIQLFSLQLLNFLLISFTLFIVMVCCSLIVEIHIFNINSKH